MQRGRKPAYASFSELGRAGSLYGGTVKKTHSAQGLVGYGRRSDTFADLPLVALPGLTSRVSIAHTTSASELDLPSFFDAAESGDRERLDTIGAVQASGGLTRALGLSALGALLSSAQFGYNNADLNTPARPMRAALGIPDAPPPGCPLDRPAQAQRDLAWGLVVSIFCLSGLLGSAFSGRIADRYGRRPFLLATSAVYALAAGLGAAAALPAAACAESAAHADEFGDDYDPCTTRACAPALLLILLSRVVAGVACGGSTVVVPMYLGEVAPAHLRGMLGAAFLLTAVTFMLVAQIAGLPIALGTDELWPAMLGAAVLGGCAQLLLSSRLIESPRWLLMAGRVDDARSALATLRGRGAQQQLDPVAMAEIDDELGAMCHVDTVSVPQGQGGLDDPLLGGHLADSSQRAEASLGALLGSRAARRPLMICVTLMIVQQAPRDALSSAEIRSPPRDLRRDMYLRPDASASSTAQASGINNAFNYSCVFLSGAGLSEEAVTAIAIAMNVCNVLVVLASTALMDRLGRRPLLLGSMAAMAAATMLLTMALLVSSVRHPPRYSPMIRAKNSPRCSLRPTATAITRWRLYAWRWSDSSALSASVSAR